MELNRIAEERKRLGLNQSELASKVGVSQKSISKYELGTRSPSYDVLNKMATLFDVSIDYLLGFSSDSNHPMMVHNPEKGFFFFFDDSLKDTFVQRLNKSMEMAGMDIQDLASTTDIAEEKLESYLKGETEPALEDLCLLADVLEISVDYLLNRTSDATSRSNNLLKAFLELDEDNQDIIIGETKKLLKEQRRLNSSVAADDAPEYREAK